MKSIVYGLCFALFALAGAGAASQDAQNAQAEGPHYSFREIWGYLMKGEEKRLRGEEPITDLCYFSAVINRKGALAGAVPPPRIVLDGGRKPRLHLVVADLSNTALMHFALDPELPFRDRLVADTVAAAAGYDGLQFDFESIGDDDAQSYYSFLRAVKGKLPAGVVLSIAVPPRWRSVGDAHDYAVLAAIVDRVLIMAYDEHWSSSKPGPVSSKSWCRKIVSYAAEKIPREKIIMGLPLYGRAWQNKRLHRSLRYHDVEKLMQGKKITPEYADGRGNFFRYDENVTVTVYFDDIKTLLEKIEIYNGMNIPAIGFWRIGQGPQGLWEQLNAALVLSLLP